MNMVRRLAQALEIPHDPSLTMVQQLITVSTLCAPTLPPLDHPSFNLGSQE